MTKRAKIGSGSNLEELLAIKSSVDHLKEIEETVRKTLDNFALIIACVVENIELNTLTE